MKRVKLFTHTDLDGVGCAIVALKQFGEDLDIEYCNYDDVNEKIEEFFTHYNTDLYDLILITDISVNEKVAEIINNHKDSNVKLLDHHSTALWLNKYEWVTVKELNEYDEKISGTKLLTNELFGRLITNDKHLYWMTTNINLYDTWRWQNDFEEPYMPPKELNDLFYLIGRDKFIEAMMENKTLEDFRILIDVDKERIDRIINKKRKELKTSIITDNKGNERKFGYVFSETNSSEIGNTLCRENIHLDFIAILDITNMKVGLRSILQENELHLGKDIASMFNGGGHTQASGCNLEGFWKELTIEYMNN